MSAKGFIVMTGKVERNINFGNSAIGKCTLAKPLAKVEQLAHLDVDLLAWPATNQLIIMPLAESALAIE